MSFILGRGSRRPGGEQLFGIDDQRCKYYRVSLLVAAQIQR